MLVSEIKPQAGMARRLSDHRQHIGQARPRAHPGLCVERVSQWKQRMRARQCPLKLDRRRRRIAAGKLDAGGETNAAVHRRQHVAEIGIEHGMVEDGIAARRQVQMVTALDVERDRIAERTKHQVGPRSERHHGLTRTDRAGGRSDPPPPADVLFEGLRICGRKASPFALEQRSIGFGQPARIEDESGLGEMDRAGEFAVEMRLALQNRLAVENFAFNPVLPGPLEIPHCAGERCILPIHFDPAAPPH